MDRFIAGLFLPLDGGAIRGLLAGDIGRPMAGLFRPWGGGPFRMAGLIGRFAGCGRGFDGLAARQVRGTTPCWDRSRRVARHYFVSKSS